MRLLFRRKPISHRFQRFQFSVTKTWGTTRHKEVLYIILLYIINYIYILYFIVPTLHRQTNLLKTENAENGLPLLLRSREKGKISRQKLHRLRDFLQPSVCSENLPSRTKKTENPPRKLDIAFLRLYLCSVDLLTTDYTDSHRFFQLYHPDGIKF